MAEEKMLLCNESEEGYWYCRDEKESYRFVPAIQYDILLDLASISTDSGALDMDMVVEMLSDWKKNSYVRYDNIIGNIEECIQYEEMNKFYCMMDGIEREARETITDYVADEYNGDFLDWIEDKLSETYLYYNSIDWGCSEEPEEGLCDIIIETMQRGGEITEMTKEILDNLYKEWKESNEDEYDDEEW